MPPSITRHFSLFFSVLSLAIALLAVPSTAFGYTDPGTGAFVYQAAYAAFLGGTFYFRRLLDRIWNRRRK